MNMYRLSKAGINVAEGVNRFNGSSEIYEKYLRKFASDPNFTALCEAVDASDLKAAFAAAHALKGVAGNLSIEKLYNDLHPLVEALRNGVMQNAKELLAPVKQDYESIVEALQ